MLKVTLAKPRLVTLMTSSGFSQFGLGDFKFISERLCFKLGTGVLKMQAFTLQGGCRDKTCKPRPHTGWKTIHELLLNFYCVKVPLVAFV